MCITDIVTSIAVACGALDKHCANTAKYPDELGVLIATRRLRNLPVEPMTRSSLTEGAAAVCSRRALARYFGTPGPRQTQPGMALPQ